MKPVTADEMTWHHISNPIKVNYNPIKVNYKDLVDVARSKSFMFISRLSPEKGVRLNAAESALAGVLADFIGDGEERDAIHQNP